MPILRVRHNRENPYFMLNRAAVHDERLSFKAVGIHTYLMSKPDNWQVKIKDLVARHKDGRDAVSAGLQELIAAGYVIRQQIRDNMGRILGTEISVYETPQDATEVGVATRNGKSGPGNGTGTGFTGMGFPGPGKPHPLVSNDQSSSKIERNNDEESEEGGCPPGNNPPARSPSASFLRATGQKPQKGAPPVGALFEDDNPSQSPPKDDYAACAAATLADALAAKGRFMGRRKPNLAKWAAEIRDWLATGEVSEEDFDATLTWYIDHIGGKFVPQADSINGFKQKFVQIQDQMRFAADGAPQTPKEMELKREQELQTVVAEFMRART